MKTAVITGASSGIGLATSKKLVESGYNVHGIARDFSKTGFKHELFVEWVCDLTDIQKLEKTVKSILKKTDHHIDVLINNAGLAFFAPHEELSVEQINQMIDTNLKAPLILTNLFLRSLRDQKGFIINMASITGEIQSRWGGTYAATKAGLLHFSKNLFEDVRKNGIKVVTIVPDITDTPFYEHLSFTPSEDIEAHLQPDTIAEVIWSILNQPAGSVITQVTLRPQKHQIEKRKRKQ